METHITFPINQIQSSKDGYYALCQLADKIDSLEFSNLTFDLVNIHWFDANLCAVFGALLYKANRNLNGVRIINLSSGIEDIFARNNFLSNFGGRTLQDTYKTTIQYLRFNPEDDRSFIEYLEHNLMGKAIPTMSEALHNEFISGLMEIFNNSVFHSETKYGIFACGQYFPKKSRIDFTITDLGIGIKENIRKHCGYEFLNSEAIQWAMDGHTTKKPADGVPGGLGLKIVREFIRQNKGLIHIVSGCGYWEQNETGNVIMEEFSHHFPGTIVNISINTSDPYSYRMSSEVSLDDIF